MCREGRTHVRTHVGESWEVNHWCILGSELMNELLIVMIWVNCFLVKKSSSEEVFLMKDRKIKRFKLLVEEREVT